MPGWEMLLWIIFAVVMTGVTVLGVGAVVYMRRENKLYLAEEKRWQSLARTGAHAEGVVRGLRIHPENLSRGGSQGQSVCAVLLEIDYVGADGALHVASIHTFIEESLLAGFQEPRKVVHLLYDPRNTALAAIDRERTPLEIPRVRI